MVSHTAVRYALHRFFVQRHGWFIKGLDPAGDARNLSSPTGILKDRVPAYIHSLFEQRLDEHGLGLHELAIFAATLEHLIHDEAATRLNRVYKVHKLASTSRVTQQTAEDFLDT